LLVAIAAEHCGRNQTPRQNGGTRLGTIQKTILIANSPVTSQSFDIDDGSTLKHITAEFKPRPIILSGLKLLRGLLLALMGVSNITNEKSVFLSRDASVLFVPNTNAIYKLHLDRYASLASS
jgi:hypothetical protein